MGLGFRVGGLGFRVYPGPKGTKLLYGDTYTDLYPYHSRNAKNNENPTADLGGAFKAISKQDPLKPKKGK